MNPFKALANAWKESGAVKACLDASKASARGDHGDAWLLYSAAAKAGVPEAAFNLGLMRMKGEALPVDLTEAARWFKQAADRGLAEAQFNLAQMYDAGSGVPLDRAEAARWYRMAAEQGLPRAQWNLGVKYQNGDGVPKDSAEHAKWTRLAQGGK